MDIGYLLHGTPVAQKPQDKQTDPTRLLRSLSSYCLGFMPTRDVVVEPCVALPVLPPSHGKSLLISRLVPDRQSASQTERNYQRWERSEHTSSPASTA
jgi:hypothetical protein